MSEHIVHLRYTSQLEFSIEGDKEESFKKLTVESRTVADIDGKIIWKVSSSPGELEAIKIEKVDKKEGVKLPKGSWQSEWKKSPTKVSEQEYWGLPGGKGATEDDPYVYAWVIDYRTTHSEGWETIDPDTWIPPGSI